MACWQGLILSLHIFCTGVISSPEMRDLYPDRIYWRYPVLYVLSPNAHYTSALPCCISTKNALRLLICNTPPTSWTRAEVGPKRVLMPFASSTISTFNPCHFFVFSVDRPLCHDAKSPTWGANVITISTWCWSTDSIYWAVNKSEDRPKKER